MLFFHHQQLQDMQILNLNYFCFNDECFQSLDSLGIDGINPLPLAKEDLLPKASPAD